MEKTRRQGPWRGGGEDPRRGDDSRHDDGPRQHRWMESGCSPGELNPIPGGSQQAKAPWQTVYLQGGHSPSVISPYEYAWRSGESSCSPGELNPIPGGSQQSVMVGSVAVHQYGISTRTPRVTGRVHLNRAADPPQIANTWEGVCADGGKGRVQAHRITPAAAR